MWVKICGITSAADALAASEAGADFIGLNLVAGPRQIDVPRAEEIVGCLPPLINPVVLIGLDDEGRAAQLLEWLKGTRVRHLQVYGEVTAKKVSSLCDDGFAVWPVLAVEDESFAEQAVKTLGRAGLELADAIVLDAYDPARAGGTGVSFCWEWVAQARQADWLMDWPPIVLAGGLRPDNVAEAVRIVRPDGVDVSSGVEIEGSPGKKDAEKMRAFVHLAKSADQ